MSLWLALKLLSSGGKRAFARQVLITASVAIGTVLLLVGLSSINLYNEYMSRDRWDFSFATNVQRFDKQKGRAPNLVAAFQTDFYRGQAIEVVYVAPLTDQARIRGISKVPGPNEYYASPRLAELLDSQPKDQLGDRYTGLTRAGVIDAAQLDAPKQLVMIIGRNPQDMPKHVQAVPISQFYPRSLGSDFGGEVEPSITRIFILLGISGFLLPVLILIGSATRIASQRREENLAALRLVGATARQTKMLTALDTLVGAGSGAIIGLVVFELARELTLGPRSASLSFNYVDLNISLLFKLLVVIAVPVAAIVVGLVGLRRVTISPLGVSRRIKASHPRARRSIVLLLGAVSFTASVLGLEHASEGLGGILVLVMMAGFMLTMLGLVIAGPWLLLKLSRLFGKSGSAPLLIAARRMEYDPKSGFRAVAGVVMVVFFGAWVSGVTPAFFSSQSSSDAGRLQNVLPVMLSQVTFSEENNSVTMLPGVSPARSAEIEKGLTSLGDLEIIKIYDLTPADGKPSGDVFENYNNREINSVISCDDLARLGNFGTCASGQQYKGISFISVAIDHAFGPEQIADLASEPSDIKRHNLNGYMIRVDNQHTLEKIRTFLAAHVPESAADYEIKTYGEELASAQATVANLRVGFNALVGFVLTVGLMSMAISAVGSILERKRSYTMLRLAGANTKDLSKVVYYESLLPLVVFTLFSGLLGYGSALLLGTSSSPPSDFRLPSSSFMLILLAGYVVGALIIWLTLPLLGRVSDPSEVHYE